MTATTAQRIPTFTPTMLATYERCRLLYQRRYVDRNLPPEPFNPTFARGNAAHRVLEGAYRHYQRHQTLPVDLQARVEAQLPLVHYPDKAAWEGDVSTVLDWVKWDLLAFDGTARVAAVERTFEYAFPGNGDCGPWRLRHIPDLVLEHADGTIEHLDRKTGNGYHVDELQRVAARIVVGQAVTERPRVLSSTTFLVHQAVRTEELSYEAVKTGWERMKTLAVGILAGEAGIPTENPLCPWCPLYQAGCPLFPAEAGPDVMTDWLEGAA